MDQATNIRRRHDFWDHELASLEGISKRPRFGSVVSVWDSCTSQMGQFGFDRRDRFSSCKLWSSAVCKTSETSPIPISGHVPRSIPGTQVSSRGQANRILDLIVNSNPWIKRCGACKSPDGRFLSREIVGALPQRLVVVPGQFIQGLISGATSDCVQFSYCRPMGSRRQPTAGLEGSTIGTNIFDSIGPMGKRELRTLKFECTMAERVVVQSLAEYLLPTTRTRSYPHGLGRPRSSSTSVSTKLLWALQLRPSEVVLTML